MANSKIPVATTIPLSSLGGKEFYVVIIQEETNKRKWNNLWMFCKGCDVAYFCTSKIAEKDDFTMTIDGIKALDKVGRFDECKEIMLEDLF